MKSGGIKVPDHRMNLPKFIHISSCQLGKFSPSLKLPNNSQLILDTGSNPYNVSWKA